MRKLVRSVTKNFMTEDKASEVADFFLEHHVPGMERIVSQVCERIRLSEAWLKRDTQLLQEYLSSY